VLMAPEFPEMNQIKLEVREEMKGFVEKIGWAVNWRKKSCTS